MKKIGIVCIAILIAIFASGLPLWAQITYAAEVTAFVVKVSPSTTSVNQASDLSITAVDAGGATVKDYAGNVYIEIIGLEDLTDVQIPGDGIYTFTAQDQGSVTLSKGLMIKAPGSFTVKVSDINTDAISGSTQIAVAATTTTTTQTANITFSSPLHNGTETNATVSIVGNAGVKNAKVELYINGTSVKQAIADANGGFTAFLTDLQAGQYILKAQVKDVNDMVVATSSDLAFTYQPLQLGDIKGLDILPSKTLKQGQKASFTVTLGADIVSTEVIVRDQEGNVQKLPLDKINDGVFQKSLLMDKVGTYAIDILYSNGVENKTESNVASITILEGKGLKEVTYIVDPIDKTKLHLSWMPIGSFDHVLAQYSLNKDTLTDNNALFTGTTGTITDVDVAHNNYYIRLFPADVSGNIIGEPSDVILVEQVQGSAPVCRVTGIAVSTIKMGDQYFLSWKAAENAERYIVYRSDRAVNSVAEMQKVGETSDIKFPYPFDAQAKTEGYAYYAVVAICQDGKTLQIGETRKVKVGPTLNIVVILLLSMMIFGMYRMRRIK